MFQQVFSGEIITSDMKKPDTPQFSKENPLKTNVFVNGIELLLSPEFSQKGAILILIDGHTKFNSEGNNQFKNYSKFPIPLEQEILRDTKIEIFAWNKIGDGNTITCNLNLSMSKTPQPFNSQAVPLGQDVLNLAVSTPETIFENQSRASNDYTKLIDMKGNKKMLITISKPNPIMEQSDPIQIGFSGGVNELDKCVDGNLSTQSGSGALSWLNRTGEVSVDFGSKKNRHFKVKVELTATPTGIFNIYTSDDRIIWNLKDTGSVIGTVGENLYDAGEHSARYVKLEYVAGGSTGNALNVKFNEFFDALVMGGTGSLAFELLEISTNQWITYIPSSEFGTITDGSSAVLVEIGDVNTKSISGKTYALPSTQTQFRAKYSIVDGALFNAISMIMVA